VAATGCRWIDVETAPQPVTVYHRTKLAAEALLAAAASDDFVVRVVRMSRCFPEPVDRQALYRLHRGIDARDVAAAHLAALVADGASFQCHLASGWTPFQREDVDALGEAADQVLARRCPALVEAFHRRGWPLPRRIDRVYDPAPSLAAWGWRSRHGFEEVLAEHDRGSLEVLPRAPWYRDRAGE
jgi:UDP-glucose 4-epimerase